MPYGLDLDRLLLSLWGTTGWWVFGQRIFIGRSLLLFLLAIHFFVLGFRLGTEYSIVDVVDAECGLPETLRCCVIKEGR